MNDNSRDEGWGFTDPLVWAKNIELRLESGISVPVEEVNACLKMGGEEPLDLSMTRDEAMAMLVEATGLSVAEILEISARYRGRRDS